MARDASIYGFTGSAQGVILFTDAVANITSARKIICSRALFDHHSSPSWHSPEQRGTDLIDDRA
jgi:hypothetical protein